MRDNEETNNEATEERPTKKKNRKNRGKVEFLGNIQMNIIATIVFIIFYFFFGAHNYYAKQDLIKERAVLYHRIDSITHQITTDSTMVDALKNDEKALEKYVRENFYMYRENEEVFIIDTLL